jgi:hypothetical protein
MIERLRKNQKVESISKPKAFWRVISLTGWWLLIFGLLATFGFIMGLVFGEVFFSIPSKDVRFVTISFDNHPFWFLLILIINGAIALAIWMQFFKWLKQRNT